MTGSIHGLAPREVYRDPEDRSSGGGLLHRRFTLTPTAIAECRGGLFSVTLRCKQFFGVSLIHYSPILI
jgi:hypothetical protein